MKAARFIVLGSLMCSCAVLAQTRRAPTESSSPAVSFRPFFLATFQDFAAHQTFQAAFGRATHPFLGGGLDLAFRNGIFVDLTASHFSRKGQRAFVFNGKTYRLGIPLTATEIPLEVSAGYRYARWRIRPYAGGGVGAYIYRESSGFAASGENVATTHVGYFVVGGAEVPLTSWVAGAFDVQWTRVPGILGRSGLSQGGGFAGGSENDLGGIAPRVRLIFGH